MPQPAAILCLASALGAQAPGPTASLGPVRSVSLKVLIPDSNRAAVGLDPDQVREDLTTFFTRNGLPVLPASEVEGAEGAYCLEVSPITLQYGEGTCLLSVSERLLPLDSQKAGAKTPPQEWGANYMAAQAGDQGLLFQTRQIVLSMAAHLIRLSRGGTTPPLTVQPLAAPAQADAAQRPAPERPKAQEMDFSRVKVKVRPPAPPYPAASLSQGTEGTVVAQVTIDPDGRPRRAIAVSGPAELKPTALRYALQWVFEPARLNGEPQWATFNLTLAFRLHPGSLLDQPPKRH
ncbi:energy transducer TonB [Geothrix sp.]|jgi:TonB family protein|uniref:energy transducer TonB n=1 Tax=Geothrix sp. TaxID=1962974 RepID=UPI0025BE2DC6|nr:energy transducer TonB [Geothrix sp.]